MEKSSQIAWKIVPLRHLFPLKVVPNAYRRSPVYNHWDLNTVPGDATQSIMVEQLLSNWLFAVPPTTGLQILA
jgi:hypothetical protein